MVLSIHEDPDTEELIRRVAANDRDATAILLDRHRERLRRMIAVHLDQRMGARVDPSDLVQEVLVKAHAGLPDYAKQPPIAFYPWLRQLAWAQLVDSFRAHVVAQRRSVDREVNQHDRFVQSGLDPSANLLAEILAAQQSSPSRRMEREQNKQQVHDALAEISLAYREVLVMRYVEELTMREIAECLGTSESAIKMRHMRALKQLAKILGSLEQSSE